MTTRDKKLGAGVLVIATAAVVLIAWNRRPANNDNFPDGTFWMCMNPKCKAEFTLTIKELGEHHQKHYGQQPTCPKCQGNDTIRAQRCPSCGKFYPIIQDWAAVCPYCKKPVKPRDP
jgi:hypothetical protein